MKGIEGGKNRRSLSIEFVKEVSEEVGELWCGGGVVDRWMIKGDL